MAGEWLHGLAEGLSSLTRETAIQLTALPAGLRNGISLIVRTFGDRLAKYRFHPKIAFKLQTFADYI